MVRGQIAGSLPAALAGQAFAVAYEPVWAIGTGLTPTLEQIEEIHAAVRAALVERLGEARRATPDPVRRLGQADERRRDPGRAPRSAAPWSAAPR